MNKLLIAVSLLPAALCAAAAPGGFSRDLRLERFSGQGIAFSMSLEELVSARGEDERYAPCAMDGVTMDSSGGRRGSEDAWDARASVSNMSARARFLRLVVRAGVPFAGGRFWNGYTNQKNMEQTRASVGEDEVLAYLFPAVAAIGQDASLVLGFDPKMPASRVDSQCVRSQSGDALELAFPVYLPPGDGFDMRVALASAPARYRWHDVVETWYRLFPASFRPMPDVHPGVRSAEAYQLFWNPAHRGVKSISEQAQQLWKSLGRRPCWEWCYRPFARAGDWAMTDRWSVGWKWYKADSLEDRRAIMRARLAPAKYLGVAPMWYLNVTWTERDMAFKEFPGIVIGDKPTVSRYWDQEAVSPVYSAGNTPYARLFRESIERIPREYPDVKGIGWDSCFASRSIPETHIGFAGTPRKSFRRGVPFVHESVGLAELLDFNHTHFTGPHRMANAVNYKLTAPYSIASRTDAALYEGAPMVRPEWLWRMEAHRARLGSHKLMSWHGGCDKKRMAWAGFDKMSPEDADDAHRQLLDDVLFLSYYWGVAPVPDLTLENGERLVGAMCELLELITSGWHASPACDAPEGVLVARYGEGASARIAAINPGYEALDAELSLPEDYWPQFKGGKKLKVSIPARQVMIVNPATGRSRPAATRPPVAVKKPFGIGLMRWMGRSGLLAR